MNTSNLLNVILAIALVVVCAKMISGNGSAEATSGANDSIDAVYQNIMTRTSVRSYQSKAVEKDKIQKLLHAGMAAPSAVNLQPWHFVVVTDTTTLSKIAEITPNARMAKGAPLAIVVCGDMTNEKDDGLRGFWPQDASAATENILLQAHAMGLGAVWTGTYPDTTRCNAVSQLLKLPQHIIPFCTIVIGYPQGENTPKDKWKPENVSYETFGNK